MIQSFSIILKFSKGFSVSFFFFLFCLDKFLALPSCICFVWNESAIEKSRQGSSNSSRHTWTLTGIHSFYYTETFFTWKHDQAHPWSPLLPQHKGWGKGQHVATGITCPCSARAFSRSSIWACDRCISAWSCSRVCGIRGTEKKYSKSNFQNNEFKYVKHQILSANGF